MPKFDANLTFMFNEFEFLDRFDAAADAGFVGVEYVSPFEHDPDELAGRLAKNNLSQVLFNMPGGDWGAGERGIAILPDRVDEFRAGVEKTIKYAKALGCRRVHCMAGIAPVQLPRETMEQTFVENLKFAADRLEKENIRLMIEPKNSIDMPGYFINHSQSALELIDKADSNNLFLQYDIYHMQIMEGDLARTVEANIDRIGHFQLADNPGRHQPGTGEINYPFLFEHIDRLGYDGWIGCEYAPSGATIDSLGWMKA
ncbi:MAG: 2-oxo-tetronate isomerase [Pseudomonadota bacterium]